MCNKDLNWTFLTLKIIMGDQKIPEKLHDAILFGNIGLLINIEKCMKMGQT